MSEEELNNKFIREKLKGICQDCIYLDKIVPIIREMISDQYIKGLEQGHFDNKMDLILSQQRINKYKSTIIEIERELKDYFNKPRRVYEENQTEYDYLVSIKNIIEQLRSGE
jgi:hypothetical protein